MGMAASQARMLSLLERMSDVEFEGQQINQQRLMLSNKMNEVMEKLTNMDVPTPPAKQDFLYNKYTGKTRNGKKISASMNDDGTFNITKQVSGMIVEDAGLQNINIINNGNGIEIRVNGRKTMSVSEAYNKYNGSDLQDALNGLRNTFDNKDGKYDESNYTVIINEADNGKVTFSFCLTEDLITGSGLATEGDNGQVRVYNATHGVYDETVNNIEVSYDERGYLNKVLLPNGETVDMSVEQQVNEIEYDIAVNKYNIKKIEYDKEVNEINKQTSIYQRQDKILELKLTRLDTERNALNTEIDAVKKVIQDSTEKGFKTFSG